MLFEYRLLIFYGCFLFASAIAAFIFIGPKAKTALISGGFSGTLAFLIAYFISKEIEAAPLLGLLLSLGLFCVFSWRSTKTLFALLELIKNKDENFKGKAIAFLIISLMAVMSLFTFALLLLLRR